MYTVLGIITTSAMVTRPGSERFLSMDHALMDNYLDALSHQAHRTANADVPTSWALDFGSYWWTTKYVR